MAETVVSLVAVVLVTVGAGLAWQPEAERRALVMSREARAPTPSLPERMRRLSAWSVARIGLGPASRRRRALERLRVIQAVGALAAELEAGQSPRGALARVGGEPSVWPTAAGAVRLGGDVADALVADGARDPVLAHLAACWRVGAESGTGLAAAVARLAATARAAEDVRVDLEGQLAGPRATARLLGALPAVGIAFGMMMGSDPLAWLLTSVPGRACLLAGLVLTAAGTWWTGRIASRVERLL